MALGKLVQSFKPMASSSNAWGGGGQAAIINEWSRLLKRPEMCWANQIECLGTGACGVDALLPASMAALSFYHRDVGLDGGKLEGLPGQMG